MFNRVTHTLTDDLRGDEHSWQFDQRPLLRLIGLFTVLLLPVVIFCGRLCQLHSLPLEASVQPNSKFTETIEPIPTRDGRILSSDGQILADDVERFQILAHYRWLESPADPNWLRQKAWQRLTRKQRRQSDLVSETMQQIEAERDAMWQRLALLTQKPHSYYTSERKQIQQRVERIHASVARRLSERNQKKNVPTEAAPKPKEPWQRIQAKFREALTTPPARVTRGPLVIKEQQQHHAVLQGITLEMAAEIEAHPELYPGLQIRVVTERIYPQGALAAHVIGLRSQVREEDLQKRQSDSSADPLGYELGDRIGRTGVERSYDRVLKGVKGERKLLRNRDGKITRNEVLREPRVGQDLVLTLNLPLQKTAEQLLDDALNKPKTEATSTPTGGVILVMDLHSGALVAAASAPRFDLNEMLRPTPAQWQKILDNPSRPLFPRVTQMMLPPGSTFKTLSAIAFLESGQLDPEAAMHCRGYLNHPQKHRCYIYRHFGVGHRDVTLTKALAQSCNVYFFDAARRIGPEVLLDWSTRFGFGTPTGVDLPNEKSGHVPQREEFTPGHNWHPGDTLGLSIGQSELITTPLQIARLMAAVANGGKLVTPHVVQHTGTARRISEGESDRSNDDPAWLIHKPQPIPGLSRESLAYVREGLEMVIAHPQGTGYKSVKTSVVKIAGKTGTAEAGGNRADHAWFAGYAPANQPRYAFVVVLEHGGSGGKNAGPLAKQIVERMVELDLLTGTHREEQFTD